MKGLLLTLVCFLANSRAQYGYSTESVVLEDQSTGRIRGFSNIGCSDFYLGGIARVHRKINSGQCSDEFSDLGLEEAEAMILETTAE